MFVSDVRHVKWGSKCVGKVVQLGAIDVSQVIGYSVVLSLSRSEGTCRMYLRTLTWWLNAIKVTLLDTTFCIKICRVFTSSPCAGPRCTMVCDDL